MGRDDNWYTQDESPKPTRMIPVWVWAVWGIAIVCGIAVVVIGMLPDGPAFPNPLPLIAAVPDSSETIPFRESGYLDRLRTTRQMLEPGQPIAARDDISAADIAAVELLLQSVSQACVGDSETTNKQFAALFDRELFESLVFSSPYLNRVAQASFANDFKNWFTVFSPFEAQSPLRIELARLTRGPVRQDLVAYTWVYESGFPERFVWYLSETFGDLRVVDYEHVESASLLSERTAREYSAAFDDKRWDHYGDNMEFSWQPNVVDPDASVAIAEPSVESLTAEFNRLATLDYPQSVEHWALLRLARLAGSEHQQLGLEMLARAEQIADIPVVHWDRAGKLEDAGNYDEALASLARFETLVGPGPDIWRMRTVIASGSGDTAELIESWERLICVDPELSYISWEFLEQAPDECGARIADAIRGRPDATDLAAQLARQMLSNNRMEVAAPLVSLAETAAPTGGPVWALRAQVANAQGDRETYIANLATAWSVDREHPDRVSWLSEWSFALAEDQRYADLIVLSPDPGLCFETAAIDYEGPSILVNTAAIELMASKLMSVDASQLGVAERSRLAIWQDVCPGLVHFVRREYSECLDDWLPLLLEHPLVVADSTESATEVTDTDAADADFQSIRWLLYDWAAEAAVRCDRVDDAWKVLPEDSRFASIKYAAEAARSASAFQKLIQLSSRPEDAADVLLAEASLHSFNADTEAAIEVLEECLALEGLETTNMRYAAPYEYARQLKRLPDWPERAAKKSREFLIDHLVPYLDADADPKQVVRFLDLTRDLELPIAATAKLEATVLHRQERWPELADLASRWLEDRRTQQAGAADPPVSYAPGSSLFLDGLLMTQQFDRAEELIAEFKDAYNADEMKLQIAAARGDKAAVVALITTKANPLSVAETSIDADSAVRNYWSEDWSDIRLQYPPSLAAVTWSATQLQPALMLLRDNLSPTVESLMQDLSGLEGIAVEDLTKPKLAFDSELWRQARDEESAAKVRQAASHQKLFRIRYRGTSILLSSIANNPLNSDGGIPGPAGMTFDVGRLPPSFGTQIELSPTAIALSVEPDVWHGNALSRKKAFREVLSRLCESDRCCLLIAEHRAALPSPEMRAALLAGRLSDFNESHDLFLFELPEAAEESWRLNEERRRSLREHLRTFREGQLPENITLTVNLGFSAVPSSALANAKLIRWWSPHNPSQFVVEIEDAPLVPESLRGLRVHVQKWNVVDWKAE